MVCGHCGAEEAAARCSRCQTERYCSRECQRAAWKRHRAECGPKPAGARPDWLPPRSSFAPSPDGKDNNVLLLLHGLGDTHAPFARLGQALALPQTATLALGGPLPLPGGLGGRAWLDSFDDAGELLPPDAPRRAASAAATRALLLELLATLEARGGWRSRNVFVLGFSQGAEVALDLATHCCGAGRRLGGVVAVAGALPEGAAAAGVCDGDCTPTLLVSGQLDEVVPPARVAATAAALRSTHSLDGARVFEAPGKRHGMLSGPEESRAVMEFLAQHLERRSALEDREDFVRVA